MGVNKKHKPFFDYVKNYYNSKQDLIRNSIEKVKAGTDQTIINFLLREQNIKINYLPIAYNLQDLHSKQLLFIDDRMWFKDDIIFKDCGWVYHFNAGVRPSPGAWLETTYKYFEGKL